MLDDKLLASCAAVFWSRLSVLCLLAVSFNSTRFQIVVYREFVHSQNCLPADDDTDSS